MADIAFEATGKSVEELLESAGQALMNTQVSDLKKIKAKTEKKIEIKSQNEERLLHDFLQELIFLKDAELLLVSKYEMKIYRTERGIMLKATLKGEPIDNTKHEMLVDVKAVSWHQFKLERVKNEWKAFVILDV
ncbi:Protein archease [Candidatus Bilamarchaeum dharawalense]|uniref:Protein archease n=1 Tax=Candidatus Bilamarchaeum dharawalense TaxID=2885759 RepID=A0A5E4LRF1_9ARCH|nr:Protein archease [Candidatus Bilamarchaeum dharawalense]